MSVNCFNCDKELENRHDTLYSNINTKRCHEGDHTGDVYYCEDCELYTVDDFLSGTVHQWNY